LKVIGVASYGAPENVERVPSIYNNLFIFDLHKVRQRLPQRITVVYLPLNIIADNSQRLNVDSRPV